MSATSKRLLALPLAVAVALTASVAAHAAMGGGNALTTALRPDLRSATVQSTNAVDDTTTVRVCFSKAIASLPQAGLFHMGVYSAPQYGTLTATSATRSTSNCADAVFPNDDATQYTFVTVDGSDGTAPDSGSSAVSTNGFGNIEDSTALIGSKTNNATRGFSNGADLVGVTVNNAAATIDYTFDQRVGGLRPFGDTAPAFQYNTANGTTVDSIAGDRSISSDGLTVRVGFPAGPQIQDAVRAVVNQNVVVPKAQPSGPSSILRSATRPGSGGFTDRPDLVNVTIASSGTTMDFQFDQVLSAIPGGPGAFLAGFSDGSSGVGTAATIVGGANVGNTVRVTFAGTLPLFHEFVVAGSATENAVQGAGGLSTPGGIAAGGNAGAFATGFSVAPDALSVTFDTAVNIARVRFDQRFSAATPAAFKLIDDQGSQIAANAINVSGAGQPTPGQSIAEVTFPAGTLVGARSLLIQFDAVSIPGFGLAENVQQVISPTAPAAKTAKKFRAIKVVRRAAKRR